MDLLPEVVKTALLTAFNSGKTFSWKVQENGMGLFIQLAWKSDRSSGNTRRVCSNWNPVNTEYNNNTVEPASKKKRISPSRARRNARRRQAFLQSKRQTSQEMDNPVFKDVFEQSRPAGSTCPSKNELEPSSSASESIHGSTDKDVDLKQYIDKEVTCVDFSIDRGEAGLTLELNSGEQVWTAICVGRPSICDTVSVDSELSIEELADMDNIEFRSHEAEDTPGVVLKKGCLEVWTPVAARTRSRLKYPKE